MTLRNIRAELERLKEIARERTDDCECRYFDYIEGSALTAEQEQTLERNRRCFERNHHRRAHVGFNTVRVAAASSARHDELLICEKLQ